MSNTQHTPGPWHVIIDDTGGAFTGWPSVAAAEELDCSVIHRAGFKQEFWGELSQREAVANARLIAAAPDLLEALRDLERTAGLAAMQDDPVRVKSRAAIAKATGGEV